MHEAQQLQQIALVERVSPEGAHKIDKQLVDWCAAAPRSQHAQDCS